MYIMIFKFSHDTRFFTLYVPTKLLFIFLNFLSSRVAARLIRLFFRLFISRVAIKI